MIIVILFLAYNYSNTSVNKLPFRLPLDNNIHDNGSTKTSETEITDADGSTETYENSTTEIDGHSPIEMQPNKLEMVTCSLSCTLTRELVLL